MESTNNSSQNQVTSAPKAKLGLRKWLFAILGVVIILLIGALIWYFSGGVVSWESASIGAGDNKNIATINYPAKYKEKISTNANLPNQAVGLLSIPNVISFQLSVTDKDKDINTYLAAMKPAETESVPAESSDSSEEMTADEAATPTFDANYTTQKYGKNTAYFINEYNSGNLVVGDIFDGAGHRLNFTYQKDKASPMEIKSILSRISF